MTRIGYEGRFPAITPWWQRGEIPIPTEGTREPYRSAFEGCELVDAPATIQSGRPPKLLEAIPGA